MEEFRTRDCTVWLGHTVLVTDGKRHVTTPPSPGRTEEVSATTNVDSRQFLPNRYLAVRHPGEHPGSLFVKYGTVLIFLLRPPEREGSSKSTERTYAKRY